MNTQSVNKQQNQLAVKKETIDIVTARVKQFQNTGELFFPVNYVPENALKSAWLMLQDIQDKDKKPALEICTKDSIANSLLSMVVQGLNPDKKQCYFIVYGNKLTMQRSYFGSIAVAKSVNREILDIYGLPVYEGDEFEYEIKRGKKLVTKHIQKLENVQKDRIIAAYACVLFNDGREEYTIMTMDEIKQAWRQSKMYPIDDKGNIKSNTTHDKFTADMCVKTVINKACKPIINNSSDANIVAKYAKQTDSEAQEAEVEAEIAENANGTMIDFDPSYVVGDEESSDQQQQQERLNPAQPQVENKPSQKEQKASKDLVEMAEEGPGY